MAGEFGAYIAQKRIEKDVQLKVGSFCNIPF